MSFSKATRRAGTASANDEGWSPGICVAVKPLAGRVPGGGLSVGLLQ